METIINIIKDLEKKVEEDESCYPQLTERAADFYDKISDHEQKKSLVQKLKYIFEFHTGTANGAGTVANVHGNTKGRINNSGFYYFSSSLNYFKQGQTDSYAQETNTI